MTNTESVKQEAGKKVDSMCGRVSETLESAADSAQAAVNAGAEAIDDLAHRAEQKIGGGKILRGLRRKVSRSPVKGLGIAAAAGLLAGVFWSVGRRR